MYPVRPGNLCPRRLSGISGALLALLLLGSRSALCAENDGAAAPPKNTPARKQATPDRRANPAGQAPAAAEGRTGNGQAKGPGPKDGAAKIDTPENDGTKADDGKVEEGGEKETEKETEEEFFNGGSLESDSEIEHQLRRVRDFIDADESRYREAAMLLQQVLDSSGTTLTALDGRTYRAACKMAEDVLKAMPAEGLKTYRLLADGEVKGMLGSLEANRDLVTVREVVRRYFMSSLGDDASFLLGCLYLDRHDYNPARRAFLNILTCYPDPSVPLRQVWPRLALACARAGDREGALKALHELPGASEDDTALAALRKEIEDRGPSEVAPAAAEAAWTTILGNARRDGRLPALGQELLADRDAPWTTDWKQEFPFGLPKPPNVQQYAYGMSPATARNLLLGAWEADGLRPNAELVLDAGRVYFKSHVSVLCCDAKTGKQLWETQDYRDPEEGKQKQGQPSYNTPAGFMSFSAWRTAGVTEEGYFFGDRIGKGLSLSHGKLYAVEDHYRSGLPPKMNASMKKRILQMGEKLPPEVLVVEGSALAAYDPQSGKRLWRVGRTLDEKDPLMAVRFLAPPTACGDHLLVPVNLKDELHLVALDPRDGRMRYRTFLCSLPRSGENVLSSHQVGMAVEGSDVFVASGNGIVFGLDGQDGSLYWASRYERTRPLSPQQGPFQAMGWDENLVVPRGAGVIALPADAEALYLFDRTTGALRWKQAYPGGRHCVGVEGSSVVLAAKGHIERLDLKAGKSEWVTEIEAATGRTAWTADGIFVPQWRSILLLDPATGRIRQRLCVTPPDDDPVGNLYTSGPHILVAGLNRIYTLTSSAAWLAKLEARIATGADVAALTERGGLYLRSRNWLEAARDLRQALQETKDPQEQKALVRDLVTALLALVKAGSKDAEALAREALERAGDPNEKTEAAWRLGNVLAEKGQTAAALEQFLELAGTESDGLLSQKETGGEWRVLPRALGCTDIDRLGTVHPALVRKLLNERGPAAFEKALAAKDLKAMEGLMRTLAGTEWAVQAARKAAEMAFESGAEARSEAILRELSLFRDQTAAAAGWLSLADLHDKLGWRRQARAEWRQIAERFHDVVPMAGENADAAGAIATRRIAQMPPPQEGDAYPIADEMPHPPWKLLWNAPGEGQSLLPIQTLNRSQYLEEHVMLLDHKAFKIACRGLRSGEVSWTVELPKPSDPRRGTYLYAVGRSRATNQHSNPSLQVSGHVALVWNNEELCAFSLLNGKLLWRQRVFEPNNYAQLRWWVGDMDAEGLGPGVVAEMLSSQNVRVRDAVSGTVLWERSFTRQALADLRVVGRCVVLLLSGYRRVLVCDAFSGRILESCDLANQSHYAMAPIWVKNGFLQFDRSGPKPCLTFREIPSCKIVWSSEIEANANQVIPLDDQRIGLNGTRLTVKDLRNGKTLWSAESGGAGGFLGGVALSFDGNDVAVLRRDLVHELGKDGKAIGVKWKNNIRILDAQDGALKSEITLSDLLGASSDNLTDSVLARGELFLFPSQIGRQQGPGAIAYTNEWTMPFYRKSDGKRVEDLRLPVTGKIEALTGREVIQGNVMFISYKAGVFAIGHEDKEKAGQASK